MDEVLKSVNWLSHFGSGDAAQVKTEYSDQDIERFKNRYSDYAVTQLRDAMEYSDDYEAMPDSPMTLPNMTFGSIGDDRVNQFNDEAKDEFLRDLEAEGGDADLFDALDTAFGDSEDTPSDIRRMEEEVLERGRQNDKRLRRQYPKS